MRIGRRKQRMGIRRSKEKVSNSTLPEDVVEKVSNSTLPEDVVEEILSRLPVKSLLKFECVSKKWNALIKSSYFTTIHLHRSDLNTALLINLFIVNINSIIVTNQYLPLKLEYATFMLRDETSFLNLDLPSLNGKVPYVVCSSKGLVCLRNFRSIMVWNPATQKTRCLPALPLPVDNFTVGFEFIDEISDYKLATIYTTYDRPDKVVFKALVFSRSTDFWREVESFSYSNPGVYCFGMRPYNHTLNGVLYISNFTINNSGGYLLLFDLRDEVFNVIPLPDPDVEFTKIFSWKSSLAWIGLRGTKCEVWLMNHEDQSSSTKNMPWTKQFIFDETQARICSGAWKDEFIFKRRLEDGHHLFLYDPTSQKVRELSNIPRYDDKYADFSSFHYVESLVPV